MAAASRMYSGTSWTPETLIASIRKIYPDYGKPSSQSFYPSPSFQPSPSNWTPAPSYVPTPIQVTPTPAPSATPAPAPSVTPAQNNAPQPDTNPAPIPAPTTAPKPQTAWDLWQQQAAPVTSAPPPVSQVGQTVARQGRGGSTLGNAILQGGTQYPRGMNAAAYTQDIADYQKKQNQFASTYDQMLQKLAQDVGGGAPYIPGATG